MRWNQGKASSNRAYSSVTRHQPVREFDLLQRKCNEYNHKTRRLQIYNLQVKHRKICNNINYKRKQTYSVINSLKFIIIVSISFEDSEAKLHHTTKEECPNIKPTNWYTNNKRNTSVKIIKIPTYNCFVQQKKQETSIKFIM